MTYDHKKPILMLHDLLRDLRALADQQKAAFYPRFFKTGKGQYGEGDKFLGVTVPQVRSVAKKYRDVSFGEIKKLLQNSYHEVRLAALMILVIQYESAESVAEKKRIVDFYIAQRKYVNNWDLVDLSSYKILGDYLRTHDRKILYRFAKSPHLWTQRIAMVSTYAFIRRSQFKDTLSLCDMFLTHPHDLMHKACGWMLREVGKRDLSVLRKFLNRHAHTMPRTMLRYAIEKMSEGERRKYREL